jgi:hypothetical protein
METAKIKDFDRVELRAWLDRYSVMTKGKDFVNLMSLNSFSFIDYDLFRLSK